VEVRVTPIRTEIIIRATRTQNVLGDKGRRIRELTSLVQKRFNFPPETVELYAERVSNRALCAIAQAESLRYKLIGGLAVRRACYGVLRYIMENGARGVEVIVSGKLRAQRAKSMIFRDGYMIKSGDPVNHYIDEAIRHIKLKQGVMGIRVKIMLPYEADPKKPGSHVPQPDVVIVHDPKVDEVVSSAPKQGYAQPATDAGPAQGAVGAGQGQGQGQGQGPRQWGGPNQGAGGGDVAIQDENQGVTPGGDVEE